MEIEPHWSQGGTIAQPCMLQPIPLQNCLSISSFLRNNINEYRLKVSVYLRIITRYLTRKERITVAIGEITVPQMRLSLRIQQSGAMIQTVDSYLLSVRSIVKKYKW